MPALRTVAAIGGQLGAAAGAAQHCPAGVLHRRCCGRLRRRYALAARVAAGAGRWAWLVRGRACGPCHRGKKAFCIGPCDALYYYHTDHHPCAYNCMAGAVLHGLAAWLCSALFRSAARTADVWKAATGWCANSLAGHECLCACMRNADCCVRTNKVGAVGDAAGGLCMGSGLASAPILLQRLATAPSSASFAGWVGG